MELLLKNRSFKWKTNWKSSCFHRFYEAFLTWRGNKTVKSLGAEVAVFRKCQFSSLMKMLEVSLKKQKV